jgi:hypothetical protein
MTVTLGGLAWIKSFQVVGELDDWPLLLRKAALKIEQLQKEDPELGVIAIGCGSDEEAAYISLHVESMEELSA